MDSSSFYGFMLSTVIPKTYDLAHVAVPFRLAAYFFSDVIMNVCRHVGKEGDTILRIVALPNGMRSGSLDACFVSASVGAF